MAGGKGPKNALFFRFYSLVPLWVPLASFSLNFGLPGHHFDTFLGEIQHHQGTQNSMKMNPQSNWGRPRANTHFHLKFRLNWGPQSL